MTTPTTNLGLADIAAEFGGSTPHAISEYYGVHPNVAISGAITFSSFLGISNYAASTPDLILSDFAISPGDALVTFWMRANGKYQIYEGGVLTTTATWLTGGGTGSDYECRLTRTSGTSGGTHNTWLGLSSDQSWSWSETTNDYATTSMGGHLEIRIAGGATLDNSSFSVDCTVEV